MKRFVCLSFALFTSLGASALSIGNYPLDTNSSIVNTPKPHTVIDINSIATDNGTIGVVAVRTSSSSPCANAFKVKFFHLSGGTTLTLYTERGPFSTTSDLSLFTLSPPVTVTEGDRIGLVELADCANVTAQVPVASKQAVQFDGDVAGAVNINLGTLLRNFAVAVYGAPSATSEIRTGILPVVGTVPGAGGSSFKTDVFLANSRGVSSQGHLVYHREGTVGAVGDPEIAFDVPSQRTRTFLNVLSSLGLTGKGSMDVYTRVGFEPPQAGLRIYEETGAGTKGFSLSALTESDALLGFESASLFVPTDRARFRMNVGIRTLDQPSDVTFYVYGADGSARAVVQKHYPSNYFEQPSADGLAGVEIQPGDLFLVFTTEPAFVYGSIIDNTTQDPSVQLARALK